MPGTPSGKVARHPLQEISMPPVLSGPQYLRQGLSLVLSPGLRLFVLLPLLVNLIVFAVLIVLAVQQFGQWVDYFMPSLPDWLAFLEYLLWPLFVALVLLIVFFTFTLLANLIAAPFNGFLAEKVEVVVRGEDPFPTFRWGELAAMVPRTLGRELRKLAYFLPRALALLILSLIPGVNVLAAPLWLLFGIWMMAVQYIDYPADNNKLGWNEMLGWLRARRWQSLGFGGITYAALLVPGLNILMMPAAVAGATVFWVREGGRS
jgi:CysZ protein